MITQSASSALTLADWIRVHSPHDLTHLKLQKLAFYCYGGVLAYDLEPTLGRTISFEAWQHGPVSREIYDFFKASGAQPLGKPQSWFPYAIETEHVLLTVLRIYARLSPWQLREQSHQEAPWIDAYQQGAGPINSQRLKAYFKHKWLSGNVQCPEVLANSWSLQLDRIPSDLRFRSLEELANAVVPA